MRRFLLATSAIVPIGLSAALANPQGGQVVGGSASIAGTGTSTVTVTQTTQNAVINWQSFNIGAGEKTQFVQPNSTSTILNRVTGDTNPSQIYGTLSANGRVFVINPNGVLIGNGAVINTAGFLATTHDIANSDFMAGRYNFNVPGNPTASVVNLGTITATNAGFAALVAPGVRNSGVITATFGKIGLASANGFSLDLYGDKLITIGVSDSIAAAVKDVATGETLKSLVQNDGKLKANGGLVQLSAVSARIAVDSVINTSGVIEARSIGRREGRIVLGVPTAATKVAGAGTQTVKVSGKLDASSRRGKGGKIEVTGENIVLAAATLDASGKTGGGKVLIGGDVGGGAGNAAVAHLSQAQLEGYPILTATTVTVDAASSIDASARNSGDGGKVVVWADGATVFNGSIAARGGLLAGNGGFAEVSGKQMLTFNGAVDLGATAGKSGTLLLDPLNARIDTVAGLGVILVSSIQNALAFADVLVTTNNSTGSEAGDLTVAAPITWATEHNLWLSAYRNIYINANITNTYGSLIGGGDDKHQIKVQADNTGTGVGTVVFGSGAVIASAGEINIAFNPSVNPAGSSVNGSSYVGAVEDFLGTGHIDLTGGGVYKPYFLVNTPADLQNMKNNLTANYVLGRDIDMASIAFSFAPIGIGGANGYEGTFVGLGHTISNLTISSANQDVGLFSTLHSTAEINDLKLVNFDVTSTYTGGGGNVGTIAGFNHGSIHDVYIDGATVTANTTSGGTWNVGGAVGWNWARMEFVHAKDVNVIIPSVTASTVNAGGLVGFNDFDPLPLGTVGTIQKSNVEANVTSDATGSTVSLGVLVGNNNSDVSKAQTIGQIVDNGGIAAVGGSVGKNSSNGTIDEVVASTSHIGGATGFIGGVVGNNDNVGAGSVTNAYWNTDLWPGVGIGSSSASTTGLTTGLDNSTLTNGTLPSGLTSADWTVKTGDVPFTTPHEKNDQVVFEPTPASNPEVSDSVISPPVYISFQPPSHDSGPPLILIQLGNPQGTGNPSGGPPQGTSNNNVPPGTPGFTPPPLPLRSVTSIDGERFSSIPPVFENRFFSNEVVVQIPANVSPEQIAQIARELGLSVITSQNLSTLGRTAFRFRISNRQTVRAIIRALEQRSIIAVAQPNYQFRLMQPAGSQSKGDPAQYMLNKLQLGDVHKSVTGKGVTIAVIDSEVDKRHTELQGTISSELDTLTVKEPPHSHGTAMAGAIVSRDRLLGVAPDARILAVRAFGESNKSAEGTTYSILKGIEWAVSQGARVINMSFAGPRDPSIERALKVAREKGVVLVAAAGNAGPKSPPLYPGADPNVIAVTATDAKDVAFRGANQGAQLSVAAPGVDVLAPAPDETYQMSTGTSIATAHVSGVIALMIERDPSLTPQEIRTILEATATDLGPRGKDSQFGWGLINPKKALDAVANRKKTSDAGPKAR